MRSPCELRAAAPHGAGASRPSSILTVADATGAEVTPYEEKKGPGAALSDSGPAVVSGCHGICDSKDLEHGNSGIASFDSRTLDAVVWVEWDRGDPENPFNVRISAVRIAKALLTSSRHATVESTEEMADLPALLRIHSRGSCASHPSTSEWTC